MLTKEPQLTATRSSLEEMLEAIRKREEKPKDAPPALPARPLSKARLPSARRSLPNNFKIGEEAAPVKEFLSNGKKRDRAQEEDKGLENGEIGEFGINKLLKVRVVQAAESPYDEKKVEENGLVNNKGKCEQMAEYIRKLRLCIWSFLELEESYYLSRKCFAICCEMHRNRHKRSIRLMN